MDLTAYIPLVSVVATVSIALATLYLNTGDRRATVASKLTGSALAIVTALENRVDDLEKEGERKKQQIEHLEAEAIRVENLHSDRVAILEARISEQTGTIKVQGEKMSTMDADLKRRDATISALETKVVELQTEREALASRVSELENQVFIIERDRDTWKERALAAERRRGTGRNL